MIELSKFSDEVLKSYGIKREELADVYRTYMKFANMNSYVNSKSKKRVYRKKLCNVCNVECTNIYTHNVSKAHIKKLNEKKDTDSDTETVLSEDDI